MKKTVFVYGDSISLGYGPHLKKMIAPRFFYDREREAGVSQADLDKPLGINGETSTRAVSFLQKKLAEGTKLDILLINCGLHDLVKPVSSGCHKVPITVYTAQLETLVRLAKQLADMVIWVRTTPVEETLYNIETREIRRYDADVQAYNAAADRMMTVNGIPEIDLYSFTRTLEAPYDDGVHYLPRAQELQGAFIAGALYSLLPETM